MNTRILEQVKEDEKRVFIIDDSGIRINAKNKLGSSKRHVPFENITNNIEKINFNPVFWIILIISIILLFVSGLFIKLYGIEGIGQFYRYAITFLVGGIITLFLNSTKEMIVQCRFEPPIEFFKNIPSQSTVDDFINNLFQIRDEVLKKKYCFVSEFISYKDQLDKFTLLHSLDIISFKEFEELKDELDKLGNSRSGDEININLN